MAISGSVETLPGTYFSYYEDIYQAIKHGKKPAVTAEDALATIEIIEATMISDRKMTVL
ncbi:MAG: Gfo/Idh/MocA family oxidoreductase [Cyclobacteriaceae bacterium]